jgi:Chaperone of endosialidase
VNALAVNNIGSYNSAFGANALVLNIGNFNTASGFNALLYNTGSNNTASGVSAIQYNSTGSNNTSFGVNALYGAFIISDTVPVPAATGSNNTGIGTNALYSYSTGSSNMASGVNALYNNTTGSNNIAEGFQAGYFLTTGSNNIDIGSVGVAGESNAIHIGTHGTQKATFIAGIYGTPVTGNAVMINSNGRLGVVVSSERYKTAIASMGSDSKKLQQLRPVTFKLKTDPKGALQYGLIAEEVLGHDDRRRS